MGGALQWGAEQIVAAGAVVVSLLVSFLVNRRLTKWTSRVEQEKKETRAVKDGMKTLLQSQLVDLHGKYTERGYCPVAARQSIEHLYRAYMELEARDCKVPSFMEGLMEALMALPTKPPGGYGKRRTDKE